MFASVERYGFGSDFAALVVLASNEVIVSPDNGQDAQC